MKLLLVFLSILSLSWEFEFSNTTCNCGWRNSGRIVGGKYTGRNEYPWMVFVLGGCGGSIITEWHVLTAAHCTVYNQASDLWVSVGRHNNNPDDDPHGANYQVERKIEHAGYDKNSKSYLNDISILVTKKPIKFNQYVGPVCLPNRRINFEGQYIKATGLLRGWGRTMGTGERLKLREVDLKVIPLDTCRQTWPRVDPSGIQLCTFDSELQKNTCMGDSGGPLVYLDPETNRYTQAAIVSYGYGDCRSFPTIYTAVSAYINWINDAVSRTKPSTNVCTKA